MLKPKKAKISEYQFISLASHQSPLSPDPAKSDAEFGLVWANHPWTALQHLSPGILEKCWFSNSKSVETIILAKICKHVHSHLLQILFDLCQLICLGIKRDYSQRISYQYRTWLQHRTWFQRFIAPCLGPHFCRVLEFSEECLTQMSHTHKHQNNSEFQHPTKTWTKMKCIWILPNKQFNCSTCIVLACLSTWKRLPLWLLKQIFAHGCHRTWISGTWKASSFFTSYAMRVGQRIFFQQQGTS